MYCKTKYVELKGFVPLFTGRKMKFIKLNKQAVLIPVSVTA